jgi:hypothetical protein
VALRPDYATVAELKAYISPGIQDNADDAALALSITAASRSIDSATGRQFGKVDPDDPPVAMVYGPTSRGRAAVAIDDLMDTTDLVVEVAGGDGIYWDGVYGAPLVLDGTAGFSLYPWNAPAAGRPWTMLVGAAGVRWPTRERAVRVTARWGWTAVPAEVRQACLIQASRIFRRKDAPFGIAGSPELGSEMRLLSKLDPDVAVLVSGLKRWWGVV